MKYTIEGFSQEVALNLGLDAIDLILLRWIVDFYNTGIMEKLLFGKDLYFWVRYEYVLTELPVLGINNKTSLGRRFKRMVSTGLLELKTSSTKNGVRTYYRFMGDCLQSLLSKKDRALDLKVKRVLTQKSRGSVLLSQEPISDSSISDSSINDSKEVVEENYSSKVVNFFKSVDPLWLEQLTIAFPRQNIEDEFNKMRAWLISNQDKRKKNFRSFAMKWLSSPKKTFLTPAGSGGSQTKDKFDDAYLNSKLGRIATPKMVKAVLRDWPEDRWEQVDRFLRRQYPGCTGNTFADAVREVTAEARKNREAFANLVSGVGK